MVAPRAASSRQQAAPMPLAPPVTTAMPDRVVADISFAPLGSGLRLGTAEPGSGGAP